MFASSDMFSAIIIFIIIVIIITVTEMYVQCVIA